MSLDYLFASRSSQMKASEIRELLKLLDQPDVISFAGGIPDPTLFPAGAFKDAYAALLAPEQAGQALQYSRSDGYAPLRSWLADHMSALGMPCSAENILITSGSQQALDYLGKLLLNPGDTALVGWPTYLGALGAFNAYEPRYDQLDPQTNQNDTIYREAAEAAGGAVKLAYVSVDFANPTGRTLDLADRNALLDQASQLDIALIEDAAYQALRFDGESYPSILSLDIVRNGGIENTRTIYCGTFSKTLTPGLRVGWICAAKPVIAQLELIKQASDLHSPTINQMAVHHVAEQVFDTHVAKVRVAYRERRDAMLSALETYMTSEVSWTRPEGGMFIWLTLPAHMDGARLLEQALQKHKVAFVPGGAFFANGSAQNHLRLSYSCASPSVIDDGIARLAAAIRAY